MNKLFLRRKDSLVGGLSLAPYQNWFYFFISRASRPLIVEQASRLFD